MTTITDPDGTSTIDYDPAGRRTGVTGPDTTTAYTYDPRGRLATVATDDGATTDSAQRDWDATDTLTAITATADGATATTTLAWDPTGVVPQILRMNHDSEQVDFVYGHNRALALTATGVEVFAHDYLGSTLTTPATAHLATADTYSPYGQPAGGGSAAPTFGYRGELHTGDLIHLRARDYQPATGVFLSTDPLDGVPGHTTLTNGYHYAHNNPLAYTDPLGLRPWNDQDMRPRLGPEDWDDCPWPKHITGIGGSYCEGFLSMSPTGQGISRAITTAGPVGVALGTGAAVALPPAMGGSAWIGVGATSAAIPAAQMVSGNFGQIARERLLQLASSGGPTIQVVTNLTPSPQAGRALSVATGPGAKALAQQAGSGRTTYVANIPTQLLGEMERVGLAVRRIAEMGGGVRGTEIRFWPQATEFVVPFFTRG